MAISPGNHVLTGILSTSLPVGGKLAVDTYADAGTSPDFTELLQALMADDRAVTTVVLGENTIATDRPLMAAQCGHLLPAQLPVATSQQVGMGAALTLSGGDARGGTGAPKSGRQAEASGLLAVTTTRSAAVDGASQPKEPSAMAVLDALELTSERESDANSRFALLGMRVPNGVPAPHAGVVLDPNAPHSATTVSAPLPTRFLMPTVLAAPGWGEDLGNHVTWLAKERIQLAELRLNPPELGLVTVRITLNKSDASVAFGAQHGAVCEAIEATLPRLRELLAENGVSLVNVHVSQQSLTDGQQADVPYHHHSNAVLAALEREEGGIPPGVTLLGEPRLVMHRGLVDQYA